MADEKTVWMTDGYGGKAAVAQGEVDVWKPRGWVEADAPAAGERVWMRHTGHDGRAEFPAAVIEQWKALGWVPTSPPEPVDLLHDQQLVDPQVREPKETSTKAATRGDKKE